MAAHKSWTHAEIASIKQQIALMAESFGRRVLNARRWREKRNYSANEYNDSRWNLRHTELTMTFMYDKMKELEEKEKVLRLLYHDN